MMRKVTNVTKIQPRSNHFIFYFLKFTDLEIQKTLININDRICTVGTTEKKEKNILEKNDNKFMN